MEAAADVDAHAWRVIVSQLRSWNADDACACGARPLWCDRSNRPRIQLSIACASKKRLVYGETKKVMG